MKNKLSANRLYLLLVLVVAATSANAASWEKIFAKKSTDVFRSVIESPAGGYICAGYTADSTVNDSDAYAVRLNTAGDTLWTRTFNGTASRKDLFYKVINTSDGGFAFCGYTTSYGTGSDDALWVKMDANGNILWTKIWGGTGKDRAQDIIQTLDGGFVIVGYTTSAPAQYYDAFIVKTNSAGDTLWSKRYGSFSYDDANAVRQLPDGGYLLGGQSTNGAQLDMYLVRTNPVGDTLWTKKIGTAGTDNIEHLIRNADGTFILGGGTDDLSGLGGNDGYLVKVDSGGAVIWSKIYGGNDQDDFHRVEPTLDGGYVASGTSRSSGPAEPNMWIVKTNANGDSLWTRTFGGFNHDHGYSAQQTSDGGYIFAGYSSSFGFAGENAYVVKMDANGDLGNYLTYGAVFSVLAPATNTCGNAATQIQVIVRNFGRDTLYSIPVTLQITGAATQTLNQTYALPIYPQDFDTLDFTTTLNTSAGGIYNFNCIANVTNDVYPAGNTYSTSITMIAYSVAPSVTNGARCGTGTVVLSATSPDSIYWYTASTGGTLIGTGSSYTTPSISSTTTYYAQAGLTCPSSRVAVTASVLSTPSAPVTTSGQRCGTGTVVLSATAADPILWFDAASGGSQVGSGTSFTTPSISSTTTYYAEANNGTCGSSRTAATATINTIPSNPVGTAGSRCGTGTVQLSATASDPISWYTSASGGSPVGTGNTFTTPSISGTTTYYAEASNGTCTSGRTPVVATVNAVTPDPITSSAARCGAGSLTLGASSSATIIWYPTSSGGSQLGTGPTFTTPFITTTTTYYAQATNGVCPSNYVPAQAIINTPATVNLGPDTIWVINSTVLDAGAGFSSYQWTPSGTTQTLTVTSTNTYCVTVTAANSCSASDCIYVDVSDGVETPDLFSGTEVFPNPSSGEFTLRFTSAQAVLNCQVFSENGQCVYNETLTTVTPGMVKKFDLRERASGIYLLRLSNGEGSSSRRIIFR